MRKILLFLMLFSVTIASNAQVVKEYSCSLIPDSLTVDAYAVLRSSSVVFTYKNDRSGTEKNSYVLTILDKKGEPLADFLDFGDKDRKLVNFSAKIYDAEGRLLKKFHLSDVHTNEFSSGLFSDALNYGFECTSPTIPFTIHYEYEIAYSNGHLSFPVFVPQNATNLSVEKSSYKLIVPTSLAIMTHVNNSTIKDPTISNAKENLAYVWTLNNLKAVDEVAYAPQNLYQFPAVLIRPETFKYDDTPGSFSSWQDMGKWVHGLTVGRDQLPEKAKAKIVEVTKNCRSDREKVKALYDYLGRTTRYVNISLGIGGFQPMPAAEVYRTGFGECKSLSNYMKAMLKVVGIESNYSVIRMDEDRNIDLYADYPNFNQMNHIILQVPLKGDTIWLECTNTQVPFGFIHNGIAGHQSLEITENGGRIVRLKDYHDTLNVVNNSSRIELAPDGSAKGTSSRIYKVKKYENVIYFKTLNAAQQNDFLREKMGNVHNVVLHDVKYDCQDTELPTLAINYAFITSNYGNATGNRLFIPINPFGEKRTLLDKKIRKDDIFMKSGSVNVDSLHLSIPSEFDIEQIPESFSESSPFGKISCCITRQNGGLLIVQRLELNSGTFEPDQAVAFNSFIDRVNNSYMGVIILRRKS